VTIPYEEVKQALLAGEISSEDAHRIFMAQRPEPYKPGQTQDSAGQQHAAARSAQAPSAGARTPSAHGAYSFDHLAHYHPSASRVQDEIAAFGKPVTEFAKEAIRRGPYWSGAPPHVPRFFHDVIDYQEQQRRGT
jgi:hypothetical protein